MSPRRWAIRARTMEQVHVGRPDGTRPLRFYLTFTDAGGLAAMDGREVHVMLDGHELTGILHAIPSALITSERDRQALTRVTCLLSRLANVNRTQREGPGMIEGTL